MKNFAFKMHTDIRFGMGASDNLGEVIKDEFSVDRVFLLTGPTVAKLGLADRVKKSLMKNGIAYVHYNNLIPDPTVELVDEVAQELKESGARLVVAVGGGSVIDAAKAVCMLQTHDGSVRNYMFGGTKKVTEKCMPLICIPTTAGTGSEVTAASVITDIKNQNKVSVTHKNLIPEMAILDPCLHVGTPPFITATTGMDALTHAIESYVSLGAEPLSDAMGILAVSMISENLRVAINDGNNIEARSKMMIASTVAGVAFMNGGLGVVHGIAQSIGAIAHVAHGTANALLLPYCMERNLPGNPKKFKNIAIAMGENVHGLSPDEAGMCAINAVHKLVDDINIPKHLSDVGVTKDMFAEIIKKTMEYRLLSMNPCKLTENDIGSILEKAL